ncbi:FecR family protein [Olivibacter jilunii]|uniref:FecR family protein n=1 Tax=Olivibacter jilunii TaxID=985016 RepID=UPI00103004C5|nr:FecR domain-containing protein [Olivibacter jilunii]
MKPDYHIIELLTRKLAGHLDPEDLQYIDRLIEVDEEVRNEFEEMKARFHREDVETFFQRFDDERDQADIPELILLSGKRRRGGTMLYAAVLAAAVIGIVLTLFLMNKPTSEPVLTVSRDLEEVQLRLASGGIVNLGDSSDSIKAGSTILNNSNNTLSINDPGDHLQDNNPSNTVNLLTVPAGKTYKVLLSDGTEIWLNSSTSLRFPFNFNGSTREVSVQGEAYFKVAKDNEKPFIVHLLLSDNGSGGENSRGVIQVLGTEFNANTEKKLKVALVNGAVKFKAADDQVVLQPGKLASYTTEGGMEVGSYDKDEVIGWREGLYYLQDEPLEEIAAKLYRVTGHQVVFDNDKVRNRIFTGIYNRNNPVNVFLDNMTRTMEIGYYFSPDSTIHFK